MFISSVMPPRIRSRTSKALKENVYTENKIKNTKINTKVPRRALADKTNSASDDTSVEVPRKEKVDEIRTRRERRLPTRYADNPVLSNLNNENNVVTRITLNNSKGHSVNVQETPLISKEQEVSTFQTPSKAEASLLVSRPRRVCRLPSRFEEHSISPSKYIPIQPANASTPKQQDKVKPPEPVKETSSKERSIDKKQINQLQSSIIVPLARKVKTTNVQKKTNQNTLTDKISPDTNNNAKRTRSTRGIKPMSQPSQAKKISLKLNNSINIEKFFAATRLSTTKKVIETNAKDSKTEGSNLSFKLLGSKKKSHNISDDQDVYEFTFDPNEEPQPQKKKRKKPATATKRPPKVPKPKLVTVYKSTYDQNISKALSALKKAVQSSKTTVVQLPQIKEISNKKMNVLEENNVGTSSRQKINKENPGYTMNESGKASIHECYYPSIRVEDIAADIEPSLDHGHDINYSPVHSPRLEPPITSNTVLDPRQSHEQSVYSNDPLNLKELSFFDDVPVASSSMNMSVRHPLASPWRVEFGSLPIKWHSNTYIKPNMTPAVESSFICSEGSNKNKHVYTNMVPDTTDRLPEIVTNSSNLKQTSIISFIKEVAERKAKKKRGRSVSPCKATAVIVTGDVSLETPKNQTEIATTKDPNQNTPEVSSGNSNLSDDKENSKEERRTRKRKNDENISNKPAKSPRKQKDKDCTYFGFDDSENQDQENLLPIKEKSIGKGRLLRSRAVLQEINGPSRAALPIAAKSKSKTITSSEAIKKACEEGKSAEDAPVFPDKNIGDNVTNVEDECLSFNNDSQSVHLFEDIDVVHHLKPLRKSYGKAKKVTFCQNSTSDRRPQEVVNNLKDTSFEDDLADITFEVPNVKEKKKTKKKPKNLMSKKEEKEADEWAAGFNSMCEEIEDFQLVVEKLWSDNVMDGDLKPTIRA